MSKNLVLRSVAVLLIGTGAALAQTTAPAPKTTAPKATAPKATAPKATAPKATAPAPKATAPAPKATAPAPKATAPAATAPKATAPKAAAPAATPKATAPKATAPKASAPKAAAPAAAPAGAPVNLNTATAKELESLHQIGPARAKDIVDARAKGKFKNWDDFVTRKVVPKNAEDAIKARARF